MAKIWTTYAWADNSAGDIDFIAQELEAAGLTVKLDRWNIQAGVRLWDQIAEFIQNPDHCDAWMIIATQTSLGSEPCREEYAYALDRSLNNRGGTFPVIALFPASVDQSFIPAAIRTCLHVSLRDCDWKERIVAATENREVDIHRPLISPYHIIVYPKSTPVGVHTTEVRPRAGSWSPFIVAIPITEKDKVKLRIMHGPTGQIPTAGALFATGDGTNAEWAFCYAQNEATPTMSYFVSCEELPSKLIFGFDGGIQYTVTAI